MRLQIVDTGELEGGRPVFQVWNDGQSADRVAITPPGDVMVGGQTLMQELRWYLEDYLGLPDTAFQGRADRLLKGLGRWGRGCFDALFGSGAARDWARDADREGLSHLQIEVVSDSPAVHSWPWEAMEGDGYGILAQQCRIVRRINRVNNVPRGTAGPPDGQLNILYVIARPYGAGDVGYQTLARPLVDYVNEGGWPVHIDILRPPTFRHLAEVLRERPHHYQVVHFDGHGGFDDSAQAATGGLGEQCPPGRFAGRRTGVLVFEREDGEASAGGGARGGADLVDAQTLGGLLREHGIPVMVLNACRSAMGDEGADDPFTSVAASLLNAGIHGVVAMGYSLWVAGAEVFVPTFYEKLFQTGDVSEAVREGRREMLSHKERYSVLGGMELSDWVVPVLFEQDAEGVLPRLEAGAAQVPDLLPGDFVMLNVADFIGRSQAVLGLERALGLPAPAVLVHGMSGVGKTTLARYFLRWLGDTGGLAGDPYWLSFEGGRRAVSVIDDLTLAFLGPQAMTLPKAKRLELLVRELNENPRIIVWDNFESLFQASAQRPEEDVNKDKKLLKVFLDCLRLGKTKIIITSRTDEAWLGTCCTRLPLSGLKGEDLWRYQSRLAKEFGLALGRNDEDFNCLMAKLDGNPLAVRVIFKRLQAHTPGQLLGDWEDALAEAEGDEDSRRIQASLAVFEQGLSAAYAPFLRLLGLHEHFANTGAIGRMLKQAGEQAPIAECLAELTGAGLCQSIGSDTYQLHPTLGASLTRLHAPTEDEKRAFVVVMEALAHGATELALDEERVFFSLYSASFGSALRSASELDMSDEKGALTECLAAFAYHTDNLSESERLYNEYLRLAKQNDLAKTEAYAYHQLGTLALERNDLATANNLYMKSLTIKLKLGDERDASMTYSMLGITARLMGNLKGAESFCRIALKTELELDNEHNAALIYHQLGMIAQGRGDLEGARGLYQKALVIFLRHSDRYNADITNESLEGLEQAGTAGLTR